MITGFDHRVLRILYSLHEAIPHRTPILAGGAVRDVLLDRPIKDYDIFLCHPAGVTGMPNTVSYKTILDIVTKNGGLTIAKSTPNSYLTHIVYEGQLGSQAIQVMDSWDKTPDMLVDKFDIGLCKVYYGVEGSGMYFHPDFIKDTENKTITLTIENLNFSPAGTIKHLNRVKAKYPDYTIVFKHAGKAYKQVEE